MAEKLKVDNWIESGYLGAGTFGLVKLWQNEETGEKIAVKTCRNDPPLNEKNRVRWKQEVEFLERIRNPNIIATRPLPDVLAKHLCDETSLPALCMEYCTGGDLRKTLSTAENCCGLKEKMIIRVCEDIASAIECLHRENIAHRDLKPENIVICQTETMNIYKVIDLGYAKQADPSGFCHSYVGTQYYLAPEIVARGTYTLKVDLWSFGVLLFECCTGVRPFPTQCQELYKSKESNIIAATYDDENDSMLVYSEKLPEVNRLNRVLQRKFEELFRLLLDCCPTKRGAIETEAGVRSWNDCVKDIQTTKVIEVFCIEVLKEFVYELTTDFSLSDLQSQLQHETGIPVRDQELFTPDGSDLTSLCPNSNLTAFMFNKSFNPLQELNCQHDLPNSLWRMLKYPERFSKRSLKQHIEAYKHSVFFIHKQISKNKCLVRGLKALIIRLLKWSRQEFTLKSDAVGQKVTELKSVVDFFKQSLRTDLENFDRKYSTIKNGVCRDLPNFEAWKKMEQELDMNNILREANDVFKRKTELQNKISAIKTNERVTKTPQRSMDQLSLRAKEVQTRYEQMKKQEDKTCWKDKIGLVRDTIRMTLDEVEKVNNEFYQFLRELFMLRKELESFIPRLKHLESNTIRLSKNVQESQQSRQEEIWQLFSLDRDDDKTAGKNEPVPEEKVRRPRRKRSSGTEIVKHSQDLVSRVKETLKVVKDQQRMFQLQLEDLDWSFSDITDQRNDDGDK